MRQTEARSAEPTPPLLPDTRSEDDGLTKHAFGEGTVTLVILTRVQGGRMEVLKKVRISSDADVARHFATKGGKPVVGGNVYRELTHAELEAMGKPAGFKRTNYFECLVPAAPATTTAKDDRAA